MTEQEKRDLGLWYDANYDPSILQEREHADTLCFQFNATAAAGDSLSAVAKIGQGCCDSSAVLHRLRVSLHHR